MKINMLENGIDSLQRGFKSLNEYELSKIESDGTYDYYLLKNAVVSIHHGIEILMKYILKKESEFLIFSSIDKNIKNAYNEKRQKNLDSIFQTDLKHKIHTVSYEEAYSRLKYLCGHVFSKEVESKIFLLNNIRNQVTHSEIFMEESEIINLFDNLLSEIDNYFLSQIGQDYKTINGYSELISNYDQYMKLLDSKGSTINRKAIECYYNIFENNNFGMGFNEVKRITDIDLAMKVIDELYKNKFEFGTDLYNGYCSGHVSKISRINTTHISMFTKDNNSEFIFKFKSMIIFLPSIETNMSPILIFESDNDVIEEINKKSYVSKDSYGKDVLSGLYFYAGNKYTYDLQEINKFNDRVDYDDDFIIPAYHTVEKFLTKGIFAHINIQGLSYGNFKNIVMESMDMDGKDFETLLKSKLLVYSQ